MNYIIITVNGQICNAMSVSSADFQYFNISIQNRSY